MIIGNWSGRRIFGTRGGSPAKKGVCAVHDAFVLAIGVWIQQHRNKTNQTVEKVARAVEQQLNRPVNLAKVNAIELGNWSFDNDIIFAVLRQVRFNDPERVARLMKDIEKISGEVKEIMKLEN